MSGTPFDPPHPGNTGVDDIPPEYHLDSYDYRLPEDLIAQRPTERRESSRLLVLHRSTGRIEHRVFSDLPELLCEGDLLVTNESRVIPAALTAFKSTGGKVEMLVLDPVDAAGTSAGSDRAVRVCLCKAAKPLRVGSTLSLAGAEPLQILENLDHGRYRVAFPVSPDGMLEFLNRVGTVPLPPYIHRDARPSEHDRERYQTVYATRPGSVAAPTAGLHFTAELLDRLRDKGVARTTILLHVGPGTFVPVRTPDVRNHQMESEFFEVPESAARTIRDTRARGGRIIGVGTTAVRALESSVKNSDEVSFQRGFTNLFITKGYNFKLIDGLITNFHLPRSTLLMLVAAFAGLDDTLRAYEEAVRLRYRFYSYGDACLIME